MKIDDESTLKTKLKFQEKYIRMLESELLNLISQEELGIYRKEEDTFNEYSIFLKNKFGAVYRLCEEFQRELYDKFEAYDSPLSCFDLENYCSPPPKYELVKKANIFLTPSDVFHKQVVLKWTLGKNEMGNALYLDTEEHLNMETLGFLIEKFFYEVCESKIKMLKGKKIG